MNVKQTVIKDKIYVYNSFKQFVGLFLSFWCRSYV